MIAFFYDLLLLLPFTFAVTSFTAPYLLPEEIRMFWPAVTIPVLLYLVAFKAVKLRGRAWLLGLLAAAFCALLLFLPAEERLEFFVRERFLFLEMLLTAACFFSGLILNRYRIFRVLAAVSAVVLLFVMLFLKEEVPKFTVCMILLYALLVLTDEIERHSKKQGDPDPKKHLLFISPFLLAFLLVVSLFKTSDRPYDWRFVKDIVRSFQSSLIRISETLFPETGWDSKEPVIGFSDRGTFGGNLKQAEHTVMKLSSVTGFDPYLYLSGRVFDSFDGRSWSKTDFDPVSERGLDTLETWCAADGSRNILRDASFSMEYRDMATKSLFLPTKYLPNAEDGPEETGLILEGADVSFPDQKTARKPVKVNYLRFNLDNPGFLSLLEQEHSVTEAEWEEGRSALGLSSEEGLGYSDYLAYQDRLREVYLQEITLSPKLEEQMEEMMEGADSDQEKLVRLESMFSDFRYTDHPGDLPEDLRSPSEFLDYFILEKREGYCSYFATAFVLLARSQGIPARYVQGYRIPAGREQVLEVSSTRAHAWAEAYLPGTGWFVYEPTPGYPAINYRANTEEEGKAVEGKDLREETPASENEPETESLPEPKTTSFSPAWYQILIPAAVGLLFILLLFGLDRLIRKRSYEKKGEREKILYLCRRSLILLHRRGIGRESSETLTEFKSRAKALVPEECLRFCGVYEELLYGTKEPEKETRLLLEQNTETIRKLKKQANRLNQTGKSGKISLIMIFQGRRR